MMPLSLLSTGTSLAGIQPFSPYWLWLSLKEAVIQLTFYTVGVLKECFHRPVMGLYSFRNEAECGLLGELCSMELEMEGWGVVVQ